MFLTIQISILTFVSLNTRVTGNQILTFKWKSQIHILRHCCFIFWIECAMNLGRDTLGREGSWDTLGREGYSRCILKIREKKAAFVGRIWRTLGIGTALGASLWRNRRRLVVDSMIRFRDPVCVIQFATRSRSRIVRSFSRVSGSTNSTESDWLSWELCNGVHSMMWFTVTGN